MPQSESPEILQLGRRLARGIAVDPAKTARLEPQTVTGLILFARAVIATRAASVLGLPLARHVVRVLRSHRYLKT